MIAQAGQDHRGAHGCLPTPRQQLLLRAAAAPPEAARQAWQEWRIGTDFTAVDSASGRLLLWIFHRREELGLSAADSAALEPHYRRAWLRNQVLLNRCAELVGQLQAKGIDCLLLKGIALLTEVYGDEGGRFLEDFDLLVRREQVPQAISALNSLGWLSPHPEELSPEKHGHGFENTEGFSCDVHWHLIWRPHMAVDESPLWAAKRPIRIRDETTFTLSVEHLLLHLCIHGMAWETVPPIKWILDVHLLLQRHGIQWDKVLTEAERRGVTLPLSEALASYDTVLPGEIPLAVDERLKQFPVSPSQQLAYRRLVEKPSISSVLDGMIRDWQEAKTAGQVSADARGVLRFLCRRWRVRTPWRIPGELLKRIRRRWRSVDFIA
ncbi:MAG: hypothetical protein EBS05_20765 [Proteobacteria bacterium]|jgi:hypothetical protein|nr:hypothetical protein [Pseudomonadota bacterium]